MRIPVTITLDLENVQAWKAKASLEGESLGKWIEAHIDLYATETYGKPKNQTTEALMQPTQRPGPNQPIKANGQTLQELLASGKIRPGQAPPPNEFYED